MRPLKTHFPDNVLPALETGLTQTREAGVFRRTHALSWRFSPEDGPNREKLLYGATDGENPSGEAFSPSPQGSTLPNMVQAT